MTIRNIKKTFKSKPVTEGAGVQLKRAFGYNETPLFDPFLMLDDFRIDKKNKFIKGFPWHPHRGIETITYILEGQVEHEDSLGSKGIIADGDVQWMTAGSGIIHQEMPLGTPDGRIAGFQLWANLPKTKKMTDPAYRDVKAIDVVKVNESDKVKIKLIAGSYKEFTGPVKDIAIDPEYFDVTVSKDHEFILPAKTGNNAFIYIIEGKCSFTKENAEIFDNETLILFEDGDNIIIKTFNDDVRFLYFSGKPLKESIAWYGPIVMNTEEELDIAFKELEIGTFVK